MPRRFVGLLHEFGHRWQVGEEQRHCRPRPRVVRIGVRQLDSRRLGRFDRGRSPGVEAWGAREESQNNSHRKRGGGKRTAHERAPAPNSIHPPENAQCEIIGKQPLALRFGASHVSLSLSILRRRARARNRRIATAETLLPVIRASSRYDHSPSRIRPIISRCSGGRVLSAASNAPIEYPPLSSSAATSSCSRKNGTNIRRHLRRRRWSMQTLRAMRNIHASKVSGVLSRTNPSAILTNTVWHKSS